MHGFYGLAAEQVRRELLDLARHYYRPQELGTHRESDLGRGAESGEPLPRHEPAAPAEPPYFGRPGPLRTRAVAAGDP